MCPACIATAAWIAAGAASTGGITALVVKKVRRRNRNAERDLKYDVSKEATGHARSSFPNTGA